MDCSEGEQGAARGQETKISEHHDEEDNHEHQRENSPTGLSIHSADLFSDRVSGLLGERFEMPLEASGQGTYIQDLPPAEDIQDPQPAEDTLAEGKVQGGKAAEKFGDEEASDLEFKFQFFSKSPSGSFCRICQQGAEEEVVQLGCDCQGDLGRAHRSCIDAWFSSRGSNICEICQKPAANVAPPTEFNLAPPHFTASPPFPPNMGGQPRSGNRDPGFNDQRRRTVPQVVQERWLWSPGRFFQQPLQPANQGAQSLHWGLANGPGQDQGQRGGEDHIQVDIQDSAVDRETVIGGLWCGACVSILCVCQILLIVAVGAFILAFLLALRA